MSFDVGAWYNNRKDFNDAYEHQKERATNAYHHARDALRRKKSAAPMMQQQPPMPSMPSMPSQEPSMPSEEGMPDMGSFKDYVHHKEEQAKAAYQNLKNKFSHHQAAAPAAAAAAAPAMDDATPDAAPNMGMMRRHGGGKSMGGY